MVPSLSYVKWIFVYQSYITHLVTSLLVISEDCNDDDSDDDDGDVSWISSFPGAYT